MPLHGHCRGAILIILGRFTYELVCRFIIVLFLVQFSARRLMRYWLAICSHGVESSHSGYKEQTRMRNGEVRLSVANRRGTPRKKLSGAGGKKLPTNWRTSWPLNACASQVSSVYLQSGLRQFVFVCFLENQSLGAWITAERIETGTGELFDRIAQNRTELCRTAQKCAFVQYPL